MAETKPIQTDVFTGSQVQVAISFNVDEVPSFHSPAFTNIDNLANFPQVGISRDVTEVETYDSDITSRLAGDASMNPTEIVLYKVIDDPVQQELTEAIETKQLIRFRNFYIIDTMNDVNAKTGYFEMFDANVVGETISGSGDSPVMVTYQLAPQELVLRGVAKAGEILYTGDYGIGGGTDDYPGIHDYTALSGNRFVQLPATANDNPFGIDTAMIALQGGVNDGWQMAVNSAGFPIMRVRNLVSDGTASDWAKIYTEFERPSAQDIRAVDLNGTNQMTGALHTPEVQTGNIRFTTPNGGANSLTTKRKIQITDSNGQPVDVMQMWMESTRGIVTADIFNANSEIQDHGHRVYSPINKPSSTDMGVVNIAGDTMTGQLEVKDNLTVYAKDGTQPELVTHRAEHPDAGDSRFRTFKVLPGKNGELNLSFYDKDGALTLNTEINANGGVLYGTNNRPSAHDIKAIDQDDVIDLGTF